MPSFNELNLAKELIRFQSITPRDAGAINSLANFNSLILGISLLINH